jgi:3'-5' exoribonuclease
MQNSLATIQLNGQGLVYGAYRVRNPVWGQTKYGNGYLRMNIEDCSSSIQAYCWHENQFQHLPISDLACLNIRGNLRTHNQQQIIDIASLQQLDAKPGRDIVRLMPVSVCPQPWLLPYLQAAFEQITIPALKRFVASVLADDGIGFAFMSAPASLNHHHNYPGGLLAHSIECFQMVQKHHEFVREEYELGLVAALFHDIGKTLTMTHTMERTSIGASVEHDKLTFEVIGPHLKGLHFEWDEGAKQLRYLIAWKMRRNIPHYNMADLVACCDRVSTGLEMQRRRMAS